MTIALITVAVIAISIITEIIWMPAMAKQFYKWSVKNNVPADIAGGIFYDGLKAGFMPLSWWQKAIVLLEVTALAPLTTIILWWQYLQVRKAWE